MPVTSQLHERTASTTQQPAFQLLDFHHLWCRIQLLRLGRWHDHKLIVRVRRSLLHTMGEGPVSSHDPDPTCKIGLGWSHFARRYSGNRVCFLFLRLLRCFNSPGCLLPIYEFNEQFLRLPYSGISGSRLVSSSSEHFVGFHALHRLWVPRYPP